MFPRGDFEGFVVPVKRGGRLTERDAGIALYHCLHFKLNNMLISRAFVTMKLTSKEEKNQQAKDASTLILDLPAFRMMRDKQLLFINCPLYYTGQAN